MAAKCEVLKWPSSKEVYLTLDLECDYGTALRKNTYEAASEIRKLIELLNRLEVPLTCFVQTELLEELPEAVEELRVADASVEFFPHSHTHKRREDTSIRREVAVSSERFEDFFGNQPRGYRFPNGNVRSEDYTILAEHGYAFDSSVFPSWRPGHFNNIDIPLKPFREKDSNIVELPFTVLSERFRIPVSLSYLKLLGRPFSKLVGARPPSTIIFDFHMHDLVVPTTFSALPAQYKAVYTRRKFDGLDVLETFISGLQDRGYNFGAMSALYRATTNSATEASR